MVCLRTDGAQAESVHPTSDINFRHGCPSLAACPLYRRTDICHLTWSPSMLKDQKSTRSRSLILEMSVLVLGSVFCPSEIALREYVIPGFPGVDIMIMLSTLESNTS
ncbi:hypothetical protein SCLCIDRAFT_404886 [Scleroderma citrinum Foug A]|uniref:Uncharacterized protein n=1 Tax=Scleroderma citrinum Foug A TaxID=1036808 RepID=A0A0C2ZMW5_9AGAM|nr:hypothetical protein SCLCIDRAFT_404886 [Scleroderma citrinum Foug A]